LVFAWLVACTPQAPPEAKVLPIDASRTGAAPQAAASPPVAQPGAPPATRPLPRWMESQLLYRIRIKDFRGLARSLGALAATAPPQFPRWAEIATRAAQAAQDRDVEAVREGCAACHYLYRVRFRTTATPYDTDRLIERSRM
jgi:hypothetical protein